MSHSVNGTLRKLIGGPGEQVDYSLPVGEEKVSLSPLIGKPIKLTFSGNIYCCSCGKKTKKSYSQGHCFVCMKKLASCDMCIMKPETCHYDEGTCREPEWGEQNCMTDHYVYLSNTSGLKVGITRHSQIPTRWIDQGATQALPIIRVSTRQLSGLIEVELAKHIADKTNWRALLKGDNEPMDLVCQYHALKPVIEPVVARLQQQYPAESIELLDESTVSLSYPVTRHPVKIVSHNFDKEPVVSGILEGIKGQYLLLDTGVINIRKFTSYEVTCEY